MGVNAKKFKKKKETPTYTSMLNVAKAFNCDCFISPVWQPFIGKHTLWRTKPNATNHRAAVLRDYCCPLEDLCLRKEMVHTNHSFSNKMYKMEDNLRPSPTMSVLNAMIAFRIS